MSGSASAEWCSGTAARCPGARASRSLAAANECSESLGQSPTADRTVHSSSRALQADGLFPFSFGRSGVKGAPFLAALRYSRHCVMALPWAVSAEGLAPGAVAEGVSGEGLAPGSDASGDPSVQAVAMIATETRSKAAFIVP
jgi:hypothetical protein